jgi:hypothetical protein
MHKNRANSCSVQETVNIIDSMPDLQLTSETLNIGILTSGGIGDQLAFANYILFFREKYNNTAIRIDALFKDHFFAARSILREGDLCCRIMDASENINYYKEQYDLFMEISSFPKVLHFKADRVIAFEPDLIDYINASKKFSMLYRNSVSGCSCYARCTLLGQKWLQRKDIFGILGIEENIKYPLFIDEDEETCLQSYQLYKKKYITFQNGCDSIYKSHVKMWPNENFERLITLLKKEYPELPLVQLGTKGNSQDMKNIDRNLLGKTSLEQVKVLLKNSLLHIDIEGGLVHMRHALKGGPSVVLFGPTPVSFFSYSENIAVKGTGCHHDGCWLLTGNWQTKCVRGYDEPPCMTSITPEMVFEYVCNTLKSERVKYE